MDEMTVNAVLLNHIFATMKKLSDNEITPNAAAAQAKLIAQANVTLNRIASERNGEIYKAFDAENAKVLLGCKQ